MRVQVKELFYWKTEHGNADRCQDAYRIDPEQGLFVVADGAGTTLFPAIWARLLAQHFLELPLMSEDPFEIEWWLRQVQDRYHEKVPDIKLLVDWNAQQKALSEGSDSTLATLRVNTVTSIAAEAQLLVFGDSCVLFGNPRTQEVTSFILQKPEEFERGPICLPSELRFFKRGFNECQTKMLDLQSGDIVILATDAVSKWILSQGNNSYDTTWRAFNVVRQCAPEAAWYEFIEECRSQKQMVDDDATAIVLEFKSEDAADSTTDVSLGTTTEHKKDKIEARKIDFEQAQKDDNKELMAIYFGDGSDLHRAGVKLPEQEFDHMRIVADALRDVLRTLQQAKNKPDFVDVMNRVWQKNAKLLINEACAANIRATLKSRGIPVEPGAPIAAPIKHVPPIPHVQPPAPVVPAVPQPQSPPVQKISAHPVGPPQFVHPAVSGQKMDELEKNFLAACFDNDDDKIVAAYEAIKAAGLLPSDFPRVIQSEGRINLAYQRREAMNKLRKALQDGFMQEILEAYNSTLISDRLLTSGEETQINFASGLERAFRTDDDKTILAQWKQKPEDLHTILAPQHIKRINDAAARQQALTKFHEGLQTSRPKLIIQAYSPLLDNYAALTDSERERLTLARAFVDAYEHGDDDALVDAREDIEKSPYKDLFAFTEPENERVRIANYNTRTIAVPAVHVPPMTIVATVERKPISLEKIGKFTLVYETYTHLLIKSHYSRLQETSNPEEKKQFGDKLEQLRIQLKEKQARVSLLQIYIDDLLIQDNITEKQDQEGVRPECFHLDQSELDGRFMELLLYTGAHYKEWFTNRGISEEDIKMFLQIFLRRDVFARYLHERIHPLELGEWLERQRKKVKYGPDGMWNANETAEWLLKQQFS
jgi:Protein phosphatase 2C